jgi:PAS domain S-box-containing protein
MVMEREKKRGNELILQIEDLRLRLDEAEETLSAIRRGEVDGLVISGPKGDQVFTLKGAERPYRFFVEAMNEGAVTLSFDGTILYCNDRFAEMVETPYQKIIGSSVYEFVSSPDALGPAFQKGKTERSQTQVLLKTKCNEPMPVSVSFNPMQEDEVPGICMVVSDLTEHVRQNELLQERATELEKAKERLERFNRQLEGLNGELQDFAFVASHDLNEPLRKIQTFGNMVTKKLANFKDENSKDYLKRMQTAAARMQTLLNSLLSYSRVTTKAEPMKKTDLRRSVKEALSNLEIVRGEKNAVVGIGDLPTVKADPVQMTQLFQNLIDNALKFHRDGESPRVKIYAKEVGDAFEIYVEDNGIGFEEKYLDKIFLPFQRLQGRSSNYEGVGMGLAICKKIVERHGGRINARSELGKGSTFVVTLPANRKHDDGD